MRLLQRATAFTLVMLLGQTFLAAPLDACGGHKDVNADIVQVTPAEHECGEGIPDAPCTAGATCAMPGPCAGSLFALSAAEGSTPSGLTSEAGDVPLQAETGRSIKPADPPPRS